MQYEGAYQRMWREALPHNSPPSRGQASCSSLYGSVTHSNSATGWGKLPGTILKYIALVLCHLTLCLYHMYIFVNLCIPPYVYTILDSRAGRGIPKMPVDWLIETQQENGTGNDKNPARDRHANTPEETRYGWAGVRCRRRSAANKNSPEDNTGGRTNASASRYNHIDIDVRVPLYPPPLIFRVALPATPTPTSHSNTAPVIVRGDTYGRGGVYTIYIYIYIYVSV